METRRRLVGRARRIVVGIAAMLIFASSTAADNDAGIVAVWKPQRIIFEYHGYETYYTCAGLKQRLRTVLTRLGAHENLVIRELACDDDLRWARVEIAFLSPVEGTPETIANLTSYNSEQLMIAKLRGVVLPSAQDLPRFDAQYAEVSFAHDRKLRLTGSDCELVRQIRRKILPSMAVRVVAEGTLCMSSSRMRGPSLKVVALVPSARGE